MFVFAYGIDSIMLILVRFMIWAFFRMFIDNFFCFFIYYWDISKRFIFGAQFHHYSRPKIGKCQNRNRNFESGFLCVFLSTMKLILQKWSKCDWCIVNKHGKCANIHTSTVWHYYIFEYLIYTCTVANAVTSVIQPLIIYICAIISHLINWSR